MAGVERYSRRTLAVAAGAILLAAACATDRSAHERATDATITAKVKSRLAGDPDVPANAIDVDTRNGEVRLSGIVESERERAEAEAVARATEGVTRVINDIRVGERSVGQTVGDAAVTTRVKARLAADPDVDATDIDVDTDQGVVTLSGAVDNEKERSEALDLARNTPGVKGVRDRLTVQAGAP
jgi:hyperosmotically inducible protein